MPSRLVLKYASAISSGWSHAMLSVSSFLPANAGVAISTAFSTIVAPALKIVIMVYSFTFAPMIFLGPKAEDRTAPTLEPSTKLRGPSFPTHDEATYAAGLARKSNAWSLSALLGSCYPLSWLVSFESLRLAPVVLVCRRPAFAFGTSQLAKNIEEYSLVGTFKPSSLGPASAADTACVHCPRWSGADLRAGWLVLT